MTKVSAETIAAGRAFGLSWRMLRAIYPSVVPKDKLPRCGAQRRDGGRCQMRAVCDRLTGRPLHGGRCRLHGGLSTGPKTDTGRAAVAESNRRRRTNRTPKNAQPAHPHARAREDFDETAALDVLEGMLGAENERVRLRAAREVLDRAGL